jgi:hypothetical protein
MIKILNKEKQRILELHHKTPMKPYLFEQTTPSFSWSSNVSDYYPKNSKPKLSQSEIDAIKNYAKFSGIPWNQIKINETPPFKNNTEGDEFRLWVNTNFKDIATWLDLDLNAKTSDGYKNIYMQRAWNYPIQSQTLGKLWEFTKNNPYQYQWSNATPGGKGAFSTYEMTPEELAYKVRRDTSMMLTILQFGVFLIPWIGPLAAAGISATIGIYDAKQWYDYGDTRTASLVFTLSVIPLIGSIASKIPLIARYGEAGMIKLGEKLGQSGIKGLNAEEKYLVNEVSKQLATKEGKLAFEKYLISQANNVLDARFRQTLYYVDRAAQFKFFKNLVATTTTLGTYEAAKYLHDPVFDDVVGETLYELSNNLGFTPVQLKTFFRAKTKEDEILLVNAMKDKEASPFLMGWKPNMPVPLKYQTKEYKKDIKNQVDWLDRIPPSSDYRINGTFGKPTGWADEPIHYKFIGGKFYSKKVDDDNTKWIEVKDSNKIKSLENMFKEKGLVKDETGYVYVK